MKTINSTERYAIAAAISTRTCVRDAEVSDVGCATPRPGQQSHSKTKAIVMAAFLSLLGNWVGAAHADDPYAYDTTFNAPFGYSWSEGGSTGDALGRLVALYPDSGNLISASLVPPCGQGDQVNGLFNIGVEIISAAGVHQPWANPGAFGCTGSLALAYPNSSSAQFDNIDDIKVFNGAIYVLANRKVSATTHEIEVIALNAVGGVAGVATYDPPSGTVSGASMVPYTHGSSGYMTVVATVVDGVGTPRVTLLNYLVQSGGNFSLNTGYGQGGIVTIPAPATCDQPKPCQLTATHAVAETYPPIFEPIVGPDIYIVGDIAWNVVPTGVQDYNAMVLDVHGDGTLNTAFQAGPNPGVAMIPFNVEGQYEDHGRDITDSLACNNIGLDCTENIWILDEAHTHCGTASGIARLDGTGNLVSTFGTGGELVFGSNLGAASCPGSSDHPLGLTLNGSTLAMVGINSRSGALEDPILALVDSGSGTLLDDRIQPFLNWTNGLVGGTLSRWGNGELINVIPMAGATFLAGGTVHDDINGVWDLAVAKFATDRIFSNGFD